MKKDSKIIFVVGSIISGLGKGIITASIANILIRLGKKVNVTKIDPYLNIDANHLAPREHGEVYVLKDGTCCDLDLGHYQRFTGLDLNGSNCVTTGKIVRQVLKDEEKGKFNGDTVQWLPHVTDYIEEVYYNSLKGYDYSLIEIGGTVGDTESEIYLRAIANMSKDSYLLVDLVYLLENNGEIKTKPAQRAIFELRSLGLDPDMVICRSEIEVHPRYISKIARMVNKEESDFISLPKQSCIYDIPYFLQKDNLLSKLNSSAEDIDENLYSLKFSEPINFLDIAIVGKYADNTDAYLSVAESIKITARHNGCKAEIWFFTPDVFVENFNSLFFDGVVFPGGFGSRGFEDTLEALAICRFNNIPTLGICLSMQLMHMEYYTNVLGIRCKSEEGFGNGDYSLIESVNNDNTLVLGEKITVSNQKHIFRNRYKISGDIDTKLKIKDWVINKTDGTNMPVSTQLEDHTFYRGVQYHPEFETRANKLAEDFSDFMQACLCVNPQI